MKIVGGGRVMRCWIDTVDRPLGGFSVLAEWWWWLWFVDGIRDSSVTVRYPVHGDSGCPPVSGHFGVRDFIY